MNPLYVGIDVSSRSNVAFLMRPDGSKHSVFPVDNSKAGTEQLIKRIASALVKEELSEVKIGMEATSVYGSHLVYSLKDDFSLLS